MIELVIKNQPDFSRRIYVSARFIDYVREEPQGTFIVLKNGDAMMTDVHYHALKQEIDEQENL